MIGLAILLFFVGIGLVVAEVLIPSFGLFTLLSGSCLVGSIYLAFAVNAVTGTVFLLAALLLVPVAVLSGLRLLRTSRFGKRILLSAPDTRKSVDAIYANNTALVGKRGRAVSPLRPAGTIDINGDRIPVVTEGSMVDQGREVEVIAVEGNRILVRDVDVAEEEDIL